MQLDPEEEVVDSFRELVRHGQPPGPNNLIDPIFNYLEVGGSAKRNEITAYLEGAWRSAGGESLSGSTWGSVAERQAWIPRVKRALGKLGAAGKARPASVNGVPIRGVWELVPTETGRTELAPGDRAEVEVGSGNQLVYGVYDRRDKAEAVARGENLWPVKVGMTNGRSPYDRIQDGAFIPNKLAWGIAINTDKAVQVERLVQQLLDYHDRRYEGGGGREWFVTSPEEIAEIYRRSIALGE